MCPQKERNSGFYHVAILNSSWLSRTLSLCHVSVSVEIDYVLELLASSTVVLARE